MLGHAFCSFDAVAAYSLRWPKLSLSAFPEVRSAQLKHLRILHQNLLHIRASWAEEGDLPLAFHNCKQ